MKPTTTHIAGSVYFPEVIGQPLAKRKLAFYLNGYKANGHLPNMLFIAPKGTGKTYLAKALGRQLTQKGSTKPKDFLEINCSSIKNLKQFINQIVVPHIHHREVTVLMDEASELPKDVEMAMLTILNPNKENSTTFSYEDYTIDFNFYRQTFIFATTEADKIFHALRDRLDRVDLQDYSLKELGEIIKLSLDDIEIDDSVLNEIASVLRGNARQAQKMANNITTYLAAKDSNTFTRMDWEQLKHNISIYPLGLSPKEIQILAFLSEVKSMSLTNLAAKTGLTRTCLQQDFEMYLQRHGLMSIDPHGRSLGMKGKDYLKGLMKSHGPKKVPSSFGYTALAASLGYAPFRGR